MCLHTNSFSSTTTCVLVFPTHLDAKHKISFKPTQELSHMLSCSRFLGTQGLKHISGTEAFIGDIITGPERGRRLAIQLYLGSHGLRYSSHFDEKIMSQCWVHPAVAVSSSSGPAQRPCTSLLCCPMLQATQRLKVRPLSLKGLLAQKKAKISPAKCEGSELITLFVRQKKTCSALTGFVPGLEGSNCEYTARCDYV